MSREAILDLIPRFDRALTPDLAAPHGHVQLWQPPDATSSKPEAQLSAACGILASVQIWFSQSEHELYLAYCRGAKGWIRLATLPNPFPGHGQMKPEQLEIEKLRREVAKLKAERQFKKKAAAYFARDVT